MKRRPTPTRFRPKNLKKYIGDPSKIVSRSSWERKFMVYCDLNPSVESWISEYPIKYYSQVDEKVRRYFIDFIVKLTSGKIFAVEIKPLAQTRPPIMSKRKKSVVFQEEVLTYQLNQDKWKAAKKWCDEHNIEFILITEKELGLK